MKHLIHLDDPRRTGLTICGRWNRSVSVVTAGAFDLEDDAVFCQECSRIAVAKSIAITLPSGLYRLSAVAPEGARTQSRS